MSVETMNELLMTRTIHADQQAVWDAWTQPEHMRKWSCQDPTGMLECTYLLELPDDRDVSPIGAHRET